MSYKYDKHFGLLPNNWDAQAMCIKCGWKFRTYGSGTAVCQQCSRKTK